MTMADNTIYDLLDEVNCADSCEAVTALCELIDELLKDIQHLELECISTRYLEYSGRFYTSIPEIGNRRSDVKETALPF